MDGCDHPVRLKGLCAICGADITNYAEPSAPSDDGLRILHGRLDLTVSATEARNINTKDKDRLLNERKLSLVVDLDQTVLHATVDNHFESLLADPTGPDYEHVKDIARLTLIDGAYSYFIKFRPGLGSFLERLSSMYELHVYTMGSRSYATEIVKLIDPDRSYFGDRIISREDSGCGDNRKQLSRIFPYDDKTVLIIDDRADVWDYSRNLVQVPPFYFFIGTGDVNAKPGMMQRVLPEVNIPENVETKATMTHFVREPDHALETIYAILEEVHHNFFLQQDRMSDSTETPDVKEILDGLKNVIFSGVGVVFSGLAPRYTRMEDTHWWRLANQYGANCEPDLTNDSTHVISYRSDTSKVLCGLQRGLYVVTPDWISQSIFSWERLPEANFKPARLPTIVPEPQIDLSAIALPQPLNLELEEFNREIDAELSSGDSSSSEENEEATELQSAGTKRRHSEVSSTSSSSSDSDNFYFDSDVFVQDLERELM